jgi:drug/metabolite transporter (DMT)-like permease
MLNNKWIIISFIATLVTAIGAISMKYVDISNYDNITFILFSFVISGFISLFYIITNQDILYKFIKNCDNYFMIYTFAFSLILLSAALLQQYAFSISPNISYTHIIINLNVIFTLIASYMLFNQDINTECIVGIIIALIGIAIIAFNYEK